MDKFCENCNNYVQIYEGEDKFTYQCLEGGCMKKNINDGINEILQLQIQDFDKFTCFDEYECPYSEKIIDFLGTGDSQVEYICKVPYVASCPRLFEDLNEIGAKVEILFKGEIQ